jgi:diketogulonate reductase-like aldo/keto reductase
MSVHEIGPQLVSGKRLPWVGLGVYLTPPESTAKVVEEGLEIGYRHIDSASCYENEKECGDGIVSFLKRHPEIKRDEIFYTSKIWIPDFGYKNAKRAVYESYEKVKELGYIDLYLIHCPEGPSENRLGTYKALQEAVADGVSDP